VTIIQLLLIICNCDEDPVDLATQILCFCLEYLQAIEEYNQHFDFNLKVQVGVNSEGSIIECVLETSQPTFDIFGDTIN
jgi:hypothetical protein